MQVNWRSHAAHSMNIADRGNNISCHLLFLFQMEFERIAGWQRGKIADAIEWLKLKEQTYSKSYMHRFVQIYLIFLSSRIDGPSNICNNQLYCLYAEVHPLSANRFLDCLARNFQFTISIQFDWIFAAVSSSATPTSYSHSHCYCALACVAHIRTFYYKVLKFDASPDFHLCVFFFFFVISIAYLLPPSTPFNYHLFI